MHIVISNEEYYCQIYRGHVAKGHLIEVPNFSLDKYTLSKE